MALGMYAASVPVYQRQLGAVSKLLEKGAAWAAARKVDEAVLGATRLIPDMLPLTRQVQVACRFAEESTARLAGAEVPKAPENAERPGRAAGSHRRRAGYLKGFKPEQIDGSATARSRHRAGNELSQGQQYRCTRHANFYFHCTPRTQSCAIPASRSGNAISRALTPCA
jgi:hypothetical protein